MEEQSKPWERMMMKDVSRDKDILLRYTVIYPFSFIIPVFVCVLAYYKVGVYPGGPNTVLTFDLKSQYIAFFASLRYIGCSDNSIFFNMSGALGNNFWGFAYYIFSPFTWITVLFPLEALPTAVYLTYLFRIGLCGLFFCMYLYCRFCDNEHPLGRLLLSCCYALMAYNIGYSVNLMWLDGVLMLPLILIGVEKILKNRKYITFIITIALSMIFNYYITCMSLIFVAIYSVIRLTEEKCWRMRTVIGLIQSGMIGVGLSMPFVLPGVLALRDGKMEEGTIPIDGIFRYDFLDVLGQLFSGRYDTVWDDGLPLLFCGTATLLLVILAFADKKYAKKIKLCYGAAIIFYLIAMCFIPLDRVMHGFRETTCFEVRYAFTFCCLLLVIAYKGFDVLDDIRGKYKINSKLFDVIGALFVIVELYMNASILVAGLMVELHYATLTEYEMVQRDKSDVIALIDDEGFYRISDDHSYTDNDGAWLGYNGFGYFSTCYNLKVMDYLGRLGECQSYHILEDHDRTPLMESLLGAKYKLSYAGYRKADEVIGTRGFYTLSKNNDALSLGYMTALEEDTNIAEISGDAFENQNNLAKELSGTDEDIFKELPQYDYEVVDSSEYAKHVRFYVETEKDAPIWVYIEKASDEKVTSIKSSITDSYTGKVEKKKGTLLIDGGDYGAYRGNDVGSTYVMFLGDYAAGEKINIELKDPDGFGEIHVDYFDKSVYEQVIRRLGQKQLMISKHSNGHFTGTIDAGEGGMMLLTLPVMDGWKIKIDGEKVVPDNYRGVLLTIPVDKGEHEIDIRFISPGMFIGIMIGLISLLGLVMMVYSSKKCDEVRTD